MESDFPLFQTIMFYWAFPSVLGYNRIMFWCCPKTLKWLLIMLPKSNQNVAKTIKSGLDLHTPSGYKTHWTMRLTLQDLWPFTIHAFWQKRLVARERCGFSATSSVCWTAVSPPKSLTKNRNTSLYILSITVLLSQTSVSHLDWFFSFICNWQKCSFLSEGLHTQE